MLKFRNKNTGFNNFMAMFYFYTFWESKKTFDFLTFSGDRKMERWAKIGLCAEYT